MRARLIPALAPYAVHGRFRVLPPRGCFEITQRLINGWSS